MDHVLGNLEIGTYDRVIRTLQSIRWLVERDFPTAVSTDLGADTSNHLVIYDIVRQNITRTVNHFFNSLEYPWSPISPMSPVYNAEFGMISYAQSYYIDQSTNSWQANGSPVSVLSNKYFIRTDVQTSYHALGKQAGDQVNVWFNSVSNNRYTFPGLNISNADTNGLKTINDVWEGYVDVDSQPTISNFMCQQLVTLLDVIRLTHKQQALVEKAQWRQFNTQDCKNIDYGSKIYQAMVCHLYKVPMQASMEQSQL